MRVRRCIIGVAGLLALGCAEGPVTAPDEVALGTGASRAERIVVLSRNLYVGANVDNVILALVSPDPSDDLPALSLAIQTLAQTDFPTRAAALAAEIERTRPHVVGLQELSKIDLDLTGIGLPIVVHLNFIAELEKALKARGLPYGFAVLQHNMTANPIPGVSLADYDAMLYDRGRVQVRARRNGTYDMNIGPVAPGVALLRGWVMIEARIDGRSYTFASTHLEADLQGVPQIDLLRMVQIGELIRVLAPFPRAVVMGDLNDVPNSPMYGALQYAGYVDLWAAFRPGMDGFTCCHADDLSNPLPAMVKRIDYVFARGFANPEREFKPSARLIGIEPWEKVPGPFYPLWMSDHAGVVGVLETQFRGVE
jgi:endonuclease/exonuclease/phosphatase family metal-dependent hydrolase